MYQSKSKILLPNELSAQIASWRIKDQVVVFTNGCFDLLHPGHLDYLEKAQGLGNRLVVGLNSDASVSRLKGPSRPITDQSSRALMLASLEFVSAVCIFEEDTPYELIKTVKPDILVKGGDYTPENIVGADIVLARGGKVLSLPFLEGYSTSSLLKKIKES